MTAPEGGDHEFLESAGIDPASLGDGAHADVVASFSQRAFARAIDFLVIAIISLAFTAPTIETAGDDVSVPRSVQLLSLAGWLIYESGTTAWLGQTVGKMAVQIKVVDHRTGARPGLARSVVRAAVVPGVAALVGPFALLVYPTVAGDPATRRGLLDRLAGTAVVRS